MPEYAIMLAVVVGLGIAGFALLGNHVRQTLQAPSQLAQSVSSTSAQHHDQPPARTAAPVMAASTGIVNHLLSTGLGLLVGFAVAWVCFAIWRATRTTADEAADAPNAEDSPAIPIPAGAHQRLFEKRRQLCRVLTRGLDKTGDVDIQVQHLMSRKLMVVAPSEPAANVIGLMKEQRIRHLLVCRNDGPLVGIVSDRDIKERAGQTAADLMTSDPRSVTPSFELGAAITIMLNKGISALPVVDEQRVVGMLTTTDLMLSLQCTLQTFRNIALGTPVHAAPDSGDISTKPATETEPEAVLA